MGYSLLIAHAHRIGQPGGWRDYDEQFRSRTPFSTRWGDINQSIWMTTVNCPNIAAPLPAPARSHATPMSDQVCYAFNRKTGCSDGECRRRHVCRECHGKHKALECSRRHPYSDNGTNYVNFRHACDLSTPNHSPLFHGFDLAGGTAEDYSRDAPEL